MARWGIIIALLIFIGALSLISVNLIHLAGDSYYLEKSAGFFSGLVHGILAPIPLILGLFIKINMYELNNSGWWYDFGFLLGLLIVWGVEKGQRYVTKNYYYNKNSGVSKEDMKDIEGLIDKKIEGRLKDKKDKDKKEDKKKKRWKFWER